MNANADTMAPAAGAADDAAASTAGPEAGQRVDRPAGQAAGPAACALRASLRRPATAVNVIAAVALLAAAWIGSGFWVPLVAAVTLAVLLWPALQRLERVVRSRVLAALLVTVGSVALATVMVLLIAAQLGVAVDRVPDVLRQATRDVQRLPHGGPGTFQRTQQALDELDRAVAKATGTARAAPADAAGKAGGSIVAALVAWLSSLLVGLGRATTGVLLQAGAIVLLSFFLLCSGDRLAQRVSLWCDGRGRGREPEPALRLPGRPEGGYPSAQHEGTQVSGLRLARGQFSPLVSDLAREMRHFGAVTLVTNAAIAVAVALGFSAFGVADAWAWGLVAGALHFVPYAGLALTMLLGAVEVYATQGSALAALLAVAYVALVGVAIGSGMAAWLQGRASRVDSAVTFGGTVFFSVLWGGWGLVLGPLLVVSGQAVWRHVARADAAPATDAAAAVEAHHLSFPTPTESPS
jgi:predicted PurR-regulated permease PerM